MIFRLTSARYHTKPDGNCPAKIPLLSLLIYPRHIPFRMHYAYVSISALPPRFARSGSMSHETFISKKKKSNRIYNKDKHSSSAFPSQLLRRGGKRHEKAPRISALEKLGLLALSIFFLLYACASLFKLWHYFAFTRTFLSLQRKGRAEEETYKVKKDPIGPSLSLHSKNKTSPRHPRYNWL